MEQKALNHNIAKIKQYHEMTKDGHVVFFDSVEISVEIVLLMEHHRYEEKPTDCAVTS